jgi:GTP-binding protein
VAGKQEEALTGEATPAALEAGRRLFAAACRFTAGAETPAALPPPGLPEVAFAGRSNVGKSSLINALVGQNALARVSRSPGRTQQINFFDLGGRLVLVDLPGYGYAAVGEGRKQAWAGMIRLYLRGRASLRRLCLLIDSRHGLKPDDRAIMESLDEAAVSYQLLLTKADKIAPAALERCQAAVAAEAARHKAAHPLLLATSAIEGRGIAELRAELAALSRPTPLR